LPTSPLVEITFALSALVILLSSLAVVLVKNPVRATLLLIVSFLPTSLIYILLHASFVGILQILVYAGAIMMLFTFVIMMINPSPKGGESSAMTGDESHSGWMAGVFVLMILVVVGALLIPQVYHAAAAVSLEPISKPGFGDLNSIAELIFKDPANNPLTVSFELISFLILVGIIAALNFSRRKVSARLATGSSAVADTPSTRPTEALPIVKREAGKE
jgi:NADH-quinone oxidoreductase subunit J